MSAETVTLTVDQFQALQRQAAEAESHRQVAAAAAAEAAARLMVSQGRIDALIAEHQRQLTETKQKAAAVAATAALSRELSGYQLQPGAAEQIASLLGPELSASVEGDRVEVRTKSYQPVDTFVRETLARPEYGHFLRGGAAPAAPGRPAAPPAHAVPFAQPRNAGEELVNFHAARKAALPEAPLSSASTVNADGSLTKQRLGAFGLKGNR